MYGLGFLPLAPEDYDFIIVDRRRERPAVRAFTAVLRDPRIRERITALGMQPSDD
jgi:putative molybdopterin biosynthesis protein